mgnify:CR=1 FL=1
MRRETLDDLAHEEGVVADFMLSGFTTPDPSERAFDQGRALVLADSDSLPVRERRDSPREVLRHGLLITCEQ